ncbi:MAG: HEAT repeat domain-containing protein [Gammaproteobacteria bacterium]
MSLIRNIQVDRLLGKLLAPGQLQSVGNQDVDKLRRWAESSVPRLIDALAQASGEEAEQIIALLARMLDHKTVHPIATGLANPNPTVVNRIVEVLQRRPSAYNPNELVPLFSESSVSKSGLIKALSASGKTLDKNNLLKQAYTLEANDRKALFNLISEIVDESMIPELLNRLSGTDQSIRVNIVRLLARFNTPQVRTALQGLLSDKNPLVKQAALDTLSGMDLTMDVSQLAKLMRDADINVQNKAVDAMIKLRDPQTIKYLVPLLKDESEYVRRGAVEVLNEIGSARDVKDLLESARDADWWVRARAADALAKIGGKRVVEAVVELIRDKDEYIRRSAIEILNATRDERSLSYLLRALDDEDWWVRERAVDALAAIGNKAAVPSLVQMLKKDQEAAPVVLRALATLGDEKIIPAVIDQLKQPVPNIQIEAVYTLKEITDSRNMEKVITALSKHTRKAEEEVQDAADQVIRDLEKHFNKTEFQDRPLGSAEAQPKLQPDAGLVSTYRKASEETPDNKLLDVSRLREGDLIDNRYRYIQQVGKGAFGTVLLVEDTMVREQLVLKILHPAMAADQDMIKRFTRELRFARRITHPNVIRIHDFTTAAGLFALSMEYFPSHALGQEMAEKKPLPIERALKIAKDIADGMSAAHAQGVIHRDLKPNNVLINDKEEVKVVDFGIAAAHDVGDTRLTKTGIVVGTPRYMAPEQVLGKPVDAQSDIYSLGCILYEMLSGHSPYDGEDNMSLMYQHVQGKAQPLHEVNPEVSRTLSAVVAKMMAVDKTKRYQNMEQVSQTLSTLLH